MKNFSDLGLCAELVRVSDKGYDTPSPIQTDAIPAVLKRRDVIAAAQTGTGKTAGSTLPMIQILSELDSEKPRRNRPVRALILNIRRNLPRTSCACYTWWRFASNLRRGHLVRSPTTPQCPRHQSHVGVEGGRTGSGVV